MASGTVRQLVATMTSGVVPTDTGVVCADDLGLVRGDGCFDATRVVVRGTSKQVDNLDRHLARFAASSGGLGLPELDAQAWRSLVGVAVAAWDVEGEATLKVVRTRGPEHSVAGPTEFLTITALEDWQVAARGGLRVATVDRGYPSDAFASAPWLLGGVKSLSYGVNAAAKRHVQTLGAEDALFVSSDGYVLEGPTSSIVVRVGESLRTTPTGATGILASVTQQLIFEGARADGLTTHTALMTPAEVLAADGSWLVSSIRGVCPISTLDGVPMSVDPEWTRRVAAYAGF